MVTFDTNVVLRILYNDDPAQAALAARAWQRGVDSGGIFLTITVLVELAWVLRVAAKFDRSAVAAALQSLCDSQGVTVQEEATVRQALRRYETPQNLTWKWLRKHPDTDHSVVLSGIPRTNLRRAQHTPWMAGFGGGPEWLPWYDKGVPGEIPGGPLEVVQR